MRDSFNYSGFACTLVMMRRPSDKNKRRSIVIESGDPNRDEFEELSRLYPPYLLQTDKIK